jgi:hypothetical protein
MELKPALTSVLNPIENILNGLACPACLRDLRRDGTRLMCAGCGRSYPIVEGIPVLIAERAELDSPAK